MKTNRTHLIKSILCFCIICINLVTNAQTITVTLRHFKRDLSGDREDEDARIKIFIDNNSNPYYNVRRKWGKNDTRLAFQDTFLVRPSVITIDAETIFPGDGNDKSRKLDVDFTSLSPNQDHEFILETNFTSSIFPYQGVTICNIRWDFHTAEIIRTEVQNPSFTRSGSSNCEELVILKSKEEIDPSWNFNYNWQVSNDNISWSALPNKSLSTTEDSTFYTPNINTDGLGNTGRRFYRLFYEANGVNSNFSVSNFHDVYPAPPTYVPVDSSSLTCYGTNDGTISIDETNIVGGISPYLTSIGIIQGTGANADTTGYASGLGVYQYENLPPGNYLVRVVNADSNCIAEDISATIQEPAPLSFSTSHNDISCFGADDGNIQITATGGNGGYLYSNDGGNTYITGNLNASQHNYSNLGPAIYPIEITDSKNCPSTSRNDTISEPDLLRATVSTEEVDCHGDGDGSIQLSALGGTAPYQFSNDNGLTFFSNGSGVLNPEAFTFSNLDGGTYHVRIKDANDCVWDSSIILFEPSVLGLTVDTVDVRCFGEDNGSIVLNPSGGNGGYQYRLNKVYTSFGNDSVFSNLSPDSYTGFVQDVKGCEVYASNLIIQEPSQLVIDSLSIEDISCFDAGDGKIIIHHSGGNGNNTFYWNDLNSIDPSFTSSMNFIDTLAPSSYQVHVEDSKGCVSTSLRASIGEPSELIVSPSFTDIDCAGDLAGSISFEGSNIQGGTAPHYLSISGVVSNESTERLFENLVANTYTWNVTDANNCMVNGGFEITEPSPFITDLVGTDSALCFGEANGSISLTASGGNRPYRFTLDDINFQADSVFYGVAAGDYEVIVYDFNNCSDTIEVGVGQPTQIIADFSTTGVSCKGNAEGGISLSISGGKPSYALLWNTGETSTQLSDLFAATYEVTIVDDQNCSITASTIVTEPEDAFELSFIDSSNASCNQLSDGSITASLSGGMSPYSFEWNDANRTNNGLNITNLSHSRYYTLTASDDLGCQLRDSVFIDYNEPFEIFDIDSDTITLCAGEFFVSNQTQANVDHYQWSLNGRPYTTDPEVTLFLLGDYHLQLSDSKGCTVEESFHLNDSPDLIEPLFLARTQNVFGDTLVLAEISWPVPDVVHWDFGVATVLDDDEINPVLSFPSTIDSAEVVLTARLGTCEKSYRKTIYFFEASDFDMESSRIGFQGITEVNLYPNPNDGNFEARVELTESALLDFLVIDAMGNILFEQTENEALVHRKSFDRSGLPEGVYFLHIVHQQDRKIIRFVMR